VKPALQLQTILPYDLALSGVNLEKSVSLIKSECCNVTS